MGIAPKKVALKGGAVGGSPLFSLEFQIITGEQ
jgi:hypothetical protein